MTPSGLLLLALVLVMSSILLGTRSGAILTLTASVALVLLSVLQQSGRLAFDPAWMEVPGGPTDAIAFSLIFAIIMLKMLVVRRSLAVFSWYLVPLGVMLVVADRLA